jgi:hypothetical protein
MIGRRVIGDGLVFDSRINISEQDCYQRSAPSMVSLRPSAFDAYRSSRRQRKKAIGRGNRLVGALVPLREELAAGVQRKLKADGRCGIPMARGDEHAKRTSLGSGDCLACSRKPAPWRLRRRSTGLRHAPDAGGQTHGDIEHTCCYRLRVQTEKMLLIDTSGFPSQSSS